MCHLGHWGQLQTNPSWDGVLEVALDLALVAGVALDLSLATTGAREVFDAEVRFVLDLLLVIGSQSWSSL